MEKFGKSSFKKSIIALGRTAACTLEDCQLELNPLTKPKESIEDGFNQIQKM